MISDLLVMGRGRDPGLTLNGSVSLMRRLPGTAHVRWTGAVTLLDCAIALVMIVS